MSSARLQSIARRLRKHLAKPLPNAVRLMAPELPQVFELLAELLCELEDVADRLELLEVAERVRRPETTVTQRCLPESTTG